MRDLFHIHQTADLAERVLLPGDPGRALRLAQALLREPKMLNHNRGLWGYTGVSVVDDRLLSIQSTGMGGPSMAIIATELIELGARRLIRIGSAGALSANLQPGAIVVADEVICDDGTSRALGADERITPSAELLATLTAAAERGDRAATATTRGTVVSTDLFYDADGLVQGWRAAGALAVEMEAATLLTVASRHRVQAACALLIANVLGDDPYARMADEQLHAGEIELGQLAAMALV